MSGKPGGGLASGDLFVILSWFVEEDGDAKGRPVGMALDGTGALLVADDVGNTISRAAAAQ